MSRAWLGGLCLAGLMGAALAATPMKADFDPDRSTADFVVAVRLSGAVPGRFARMEGELEPAQGKLWRVHVRVDARKLRLEGPAWMARSTASRNFLDVARHPEIRFVSEPFPRQLLRKGGDLAGQLHLRGLSRPVVFTVAASTCKQPGHGCEIRVQGEVSRREFGMTSQRLWVRDAVGFDFHVHLRDPASP